MKDAVEKWKQAMQQAGYLRSPHDAFHFSQLGRPGGDRHAAELAYRDWLAASPEDRDALDGLAYLLNSQGRTDEVLAIRRRRLRLYARDLGLAPGVQDEAAEYLLSAERAGAPPDHAPESYVQGLFDIYAHRFETHLNDELEYQVPGALLEQVNAVLPGGWAPADVLDIGCGTGLAGSLFRPLSERLDGIDLSQKMLDQARQKGIYDRLEHGEICALLDRWERRYDLVLAADVLIYFGDLLPLFRTVRRVLRRTGSFAFSVEQASGADYRLRSTGRYQHGSDYVQTCAEQAGFVVLSFAEDTVRKQYGQPVPGYLVVLE